VSLFLQKGFNEDFLINLMKLFIPFSLSPELEHAEAEYLETVAWVYVD
jgi:hypothetical protein